MSLGPVVLVVLDRAVVDLVRIAQGHYALIEVWLAFTFASMAVAATLMAFDR